MIGEIQSPNATVSSCMETPSTSSKGLRFTAKVVAGLIVTYVFVYMVLSLSGTYRPLAFTSGGNVTEYQAWAPPGFYDPTPSPDAGVWQRNFISLSFYPLWCIDVKIIHKTKGPDERSGVDAGRAFLFASLRPCAVHCGCWALNP